MLESGATNTGIDIDLVRVEVCCKVYCCSSSALALCTGPTAGQPDDRVWHTTVRMCRSSRSLLWCAKSSPRCHPLLRHNSRAGANCLIFFCEFELGAHPCNVFHFGRGEVGNCWEVGRTEGGPLALACSVADRSTTCIRADCLFNHLPSSILQSRVVTHKYSAPLDHLESKGTFNMSRNDRTAVKS